MNDNEGWRSLSQGEREIVEFLLRQPANSPFDYLLESLEQSTVRQIPECIGHCPSIEFRRSNPDPPQDMLLPGEARGYHWFDGIPFDVTLYARDRQLSSLEFHPYAGPLDYVPTVGELVLN